MNVDYIVVGFGLAGMSFVNHLEKNGKSFVVFDDSSQVSSLAAGGTYNPLVLKRFTPVWNGEQQLDYASSFIKGLEDKFTLELDFPLLTKKLFSSVSDTNKWFDASDKPVVSKYIFPKIEHSNIKGINVSSFGYGTYAGAGWVDIKSLLWSYKENLGDKFCTDSFDYECLSFSENDVFYKNINSKFIVFAEGFGLKKNPFFCDLPLQGLKGEVLTIKAPELEVDFQLKSSVFILPIGNQLFKVGATFNREDKSSNPTEEGRMELVKKLDRLISVPYEIVDHEAGIRPTVKDRRPLVGVHPVYRQLAVLNGLGTRGVMIGPTVAKELFEFLEFNVAIDPVINIERFQTEK